MPMLEGEGLPPRSDVVGVPVWMTSYHQMMQILDRARRLLCVAARKVVPSSESVRFSSQSVTT